MLRMKNGDYVPKGSGLETVSGSEAVLQRVLLRLTARRGAFPFMESFGSRRTSPRVTTPISSPTMVETP